MKDDKLILDSMERNSVALLRDCLSETLLPIYKANRALVFLCIGTDRSTGDCLGPLVGEKLRFLQRENVYIYGNLEKPVHAKNLCEVLLGINNSLNYPYIIAIDACLGNIQNVGKIFIENKPLHPGSALNKDLPGVGDLSITGIVNISGTLEFMVLQNTRLYTVMHLADVISTGIYHTIIKTIGGKNSSSSKAVSD